MNKIFKYLAALMVISISLPFVSCGGDDEEPSGPLVLSEKTLKFTADGGTKYV